MHNYADYEIEQLAMQPAREETPKNFIMQMPSREKKIFMRKNFSLTNFFSSINFHHIFHIKLHRYRIYSDLLPI
jgi:hypothetical protein